MTENLRDLLERAAPHDPGLSPAERSDAVVRRGRAARRRDRALVAAAGVAVLVAAVAVPGALRGGGDGGRDDVATPAPTASPCPADPIAVDRPTAVPVLGDVTAVRACPAAGEQGEPLPGVPLEGGAAAAFAADVEALPAYRLPDLCLVATVMPQPWALQVETADGTTYVVGSSMRSCSSVRIGTEDRAVDAVLAAFLGNQVRQQSGVPELACPPGDRLADGAPTWNASFDPTSATAGVVCYRGDPLGATEYDVVQAGLDADQLAVVRDDLAAGVRPSGELGGCTDTGPQRMIVLEDAEGDQAAWVDDQCVGTFVGPGGTWSPGAAAERTIDAALSR